MLFSLLRAHIEVLSNMLGKSECSYHVWCSSDVLLPSFETSFVVVERSASLPLSFYNIYFLALKSKISEERLPGAVPGNVQRPTGILE